MMLRAELWGKPIILWLLGLIALWLGLPAFLWLVWPQTELSGIDSGVAGDSFGIINALFSGLAFLGLLFTIQQQALQNQRGLTCPP